MPRASQAGFERVRQSCARQNLAGYNNGDAVLGFKPTQIGRLDVFAFSLECFASLLHKGGAEIFVIPLLVLGLAFLSAHRGQGAVPTSSGIWIVYVASLRFWNLLRASP